MRARWGGSGPDDPTGTATAWLAEATVGDPDDPALQVSDWGVNGDQVSVLLHNPTHRIVTRADVILTALDVYGRVVARSAEPTPSQSCCALDDVAPDASVGVSFMTGDAATPVASVRVDYADVAWSSPAHPSPALAQGRGVRLVRRGSRTLVEADIRTDATPLRAATVQAVVDSPSGAFLTVASGHWDCFPAEETRSVRMSIPHSVPAGSTIGEVWVLPSSSVSDASACSPQADPASPGSAPTSR